MANLKLMGEKLTPEQKIIAEYIEANAGETLCEKINAGEKTMADCWSFIMKQAREKANGEKSIAIADAEVFGWAIHYFEEDEIEKEKAWTPPKTEPKTPAEVKSRLKEDQKQGPAKPKKEKGDDMLPGQMTIMDFMG